MVTVEKLLQIPKLRDISVVAGRSGLRRKVGHVTVMEVPDIIQWLKGDDFLITSLYAVKENVQDQCKLLRELAFSSCACVAVKTGQYVKDLSDEVKATANACGIPLLSIPYDLSYIDIIVNVMNHVFEEQNPRVVLEKYIKDILYEAYTDESLMIERGNMLGLAVNKHHYTALTLQFSTRHNPCEADMQALWRAGVAIAQFAATQRGTYHCIAVNTPSHCTIFLDADDEQTFRRVAPFIEKESLAQLNYSFPNHQIYLGYGHTANGLQGIRDTYLSSLKACNMGQIFYPDRLIQYYRDLEVHAVLAEVIQSQKMTVLQSILSLVDNKEILETLVVYYECNTNLDETAARLFAHKNTVKYRLHRIKELTGLDVKSFNDNLKLYLAVVAYKLQLAQL